MAHNNAVIDTLNAVQRQAVARARAEATARYVARRAAAAAAAPQNRFEAGDYADDDAVVVE